MAHQAKKGGEYGANGEWYKGGQFVNTIAGNEKRTGSRKKTTRKVEVAPYKWGLCPEGMFPIFQIVGTHAEYVDRFEKELKIKPHAAGVRHYGGEWKGHSIESLCEMWNRGQVFASNIKGGN